MNPIKQNPYRTLGLFGNSTEKELQKQIATIKRFAEVGKVKSFDYDFPFFGEVNRDSTQVQEAASKIEQAKNKVHYALFWFINSNRIDDVALNNLKEGNIDKASEIWEKTLMNAEISSKNFSSASNLSTLHLGLLTHNGSFDSEKFRETIYLKEKILNSDTLSDFINSIIGESVTFNKDSLLKDFVDDILVLVKPYLNKQNGISTSQLISTFKDFPAEIKQYISGKFTDRPINNIENQIDRAKANRDLNPSDGEQYGEELYLNTKEDVLFLKNVWGANNVQYQMIASKLANEILQCAIDFFIEYRDNDEYDPGEPALKVMKMAKAINPTGQVKNRLEENIENLQEWISEKPERDKNKRIGVDLAFIGSKLERFQSLNDTIENAKDLIVSSKPKLQNIKTILGSTDDLYMKISSAVVNNALNMLIEVVNVEQNDLQFNRLKLLTLPVTINNAVEVMSLMSGMDMFTELRTRFSQNQRTISNISSQLSQINRPSTTTYRTTSSNKSSGGCYIATMAYGSYEHPQVIQLRIFRDNVLSKSTLGRSFINYYYQYSPKLVERLKNKPLINKAIRSILNNFIKIIK